MLTVTPLLDSGSVSRQAFIGLELTRQAEQINGEERPLLLNDIGRNLDDVVAEGNVGREYIVDKLCGCVSTNGPPNFTPDKSVWIARFFAFPDDVEQHQMRPKSP